MATITIKGTSITVICDNAQDLYAVYYAFSNRHTVIVNGEELHQIGHDGNTYFAGYTRNYFNKFFE